MKWMKDGKMLWNFIQPYNPILLTSVPPNIYEKGKVGKEHWVTKELKTKNIIVVKSGGKTKYANENAILIDDYKSNIEPWEKSGGIGILHTDAVKTIFKLRKLLKR